MKRAPLIRINLDQDLIVDSFAGGGGASEGIRRALGREPDIAINHDHEAIAMHKANHPNTRHFIENVNDVDPVRVCGGKRIGLMWLSPDCTYHSKARGGKPFRDRNKARRRRGLANLAVKWARVLGDQKPRVIIMENVEEFADWGPLLDDGTPCPLRKGLSFRRFVKQLQNVGYAVDWQELKACDYGAGTTRRRLFLVARCDGLPIVWPAATHGKHGTPYKTAAECIDWSIPCPSIFERKKPLAEATLRRIARGIQRYVLNTPTPFIVGVGGRMGQSPERSILRPMQTITAKGDAAIVTPFIAKYHSAKRQGDDRTGAIADPLPTQTTENRFAVVSPTLIQTGWGEREGQAPRALDLHQPLGTIMADGQKHALVAAFIAKHYGDTGQRPGSPMTEPVSTITACDHNALVTSTIVTLRNNAIGRDMREPLGTITAGGGHHAEVRAFLMKYHANGGQWNRLQDPLPTVVTNDSIALVTVAGEQYAIVDIGMRMLEPRELFAAQGFGPDYIIDPVVDGRPLPKYAQVRMCGNSVSPDPAEALVAANFGVRHAEQRLLA